MSPGWSGKKPETDELQVEVEIDPEHVWRCEQLQKIGFSEFQSFRLSLAGIDWHEAESLLKKGATPEEAVAILV